MRGGGSVELPKGGAHNRNLREGKLGSCSLWGYVPGWHIWGRSGWWVRGPNGDKRSFVPQVPFSCRLAYPTPIPNLSVPILCSRGWKNSSHHFVFYNDRGLVTLSWTIRHKPKPVRVLSNSSFFTHGADVPCTIPSPCCPPGMGM